MIYRQYLKFVSLSLFLLLLGTNIFAQASVEFFSDSDTERYNVMRDLGANIIAHGSFESYNFSTSSNLISINRDFYSKVNFNFRLETVVNNEVSFVLGLRNKDYLAGSEGLNYYQYNQTQRTEENIPENDKLDIEADLFYLEYRHNPLAKLRIGRQSVAIADKKGMVFSGEINGFTQTCSMGTWCYYIGLASNPDHQNFRFWHLSYPFFDAGSKSNTYWRDDFSRSRLDVEIYNLDYSADNLALAKFGGTAASPSSSTPNLHSPDQVTTANGDYVSRNAHWRYWGLNLDWQQAPFYLTANFVKLSGKSDFYSTNSTGTKSGLETRSVTGTAFLVDTAFEISERYRLRAKIFTASGNKYNSDATSTTPASSRVDEDRSFYEINRGSFEGAMIYLNDGNSFGQSHSISNLSFLNLNYGYKSLTKFFAMNIDYYYLQRTNEVFNSAGSRVKNIGHEFDFDFSFNLKNNIELGITYALFLPGTAYSSNDNLVPAEAKESNFNALGLKVGYVF